MRQKKTLKPEENCSSLHRPSQVDPALQQIWEAVLNHATGLKCSFPLQLNPAIRSENFTFPKPLSNEEFTAISVNRYWAYRLERKTSKNRGQ